MRLHVVVIGTGIVGACTALELLRDGHRVTLLDPGEPGGRQAASFGNGGWISPASILPMSSPGLWRKVPGYLRDPAGPFTIRWRSLPALLPWLVRFVWAGATAARVEATAAQLRALLGDAPARHIRLAGEAGVAELIRQAGLVYAFPDREAFEAERGSWELRRRHGIAWREIEGEAVAEAVPGLAGRYRFAALVLEGAHCRDPGGYVAGLARHAEALGATRMRARVTGFRVERRRLRAVRTGGGELACDRAVIAAGIGAGALARAAGDRVSLASERGYHVVVSDPEAAAGHAALPVMPSDGRMANTAMRAGLRAAGQVELAAPEAAPDWRRADILLGHLLALYPGLAGPIPEARLSRWMGNRPSTPDGLPVIGPARATPDIVHAFGHGHVGLAAGPITGRIAADLLAGREPAIPIAAFAAGRFRLGGRS